MMTKSIFKMVLLTSLPLIFSMEDEKLQGSQAGHNFQHLNPHDYAEKRRKDLLQKVKDYEQTDEGRKAKENLEFHMDRFYPEKPTPGEGDY